MPEYYESLQVFHRALYAYRFQWLYHVALWRRISCGIFLQMPDVITRVEETTVIPRSACLPVRARLFVTGQIRVGWGMKKNFHPKKITGKWSRYHVHSSSSEHRVRLESLYCTGVLVETNDDERVPNGPKTFTIVLIRVRVRYMYIYIFALFLHHPHLTAATTRVSLALLRLLALANVFSSPITHPTTTSAIDPGPFLLYYRSRTILLFHTTRSMSFSTQILFHPLSRSFYSQSSIVFRLILLSSLFPNGMDPITEIAYVHGHYRDKTSAVNAAELRLVYIVYLK